MVKLTKDLKADEFFEYYFLKEELKDFCRREGLKVSGNKQDLEKRIVHYLETGDELTETSFNKKSCKTLFEIALDATTSPFTLIVNPACAVARTLAYV